MCVKTRYRHALAIIGKKQLSDVSRKAFHSLYAFVYAAAKNKEKHHSPSHRPVPSRTPKKTKRARSNFWGIFGLASGLEASESAAVEKASYK